MEKFPITKEGFVRIEEEVKNLKNVERPAITKMIAEARAHGDLSENAEYHAAREKQSFCEGRVKELEHKIANAEVIDVASISGNVVKFGATVQLVDLDTDKEKKYQIVGEYEADLDKGKISIKSPIARALISKEQGDEVEVFAPGGERAYEILSVKYQ